MSSFSFSNSETFKDGRGFHGPFQLSLTNKADRTQPARKMSDISQRPSTWK